MTAPTFVFVYGTLLRGEPNHRVLARATFLGPALTAPRYLLVDLGAFPAMLDAGRTAIRGEVFACDADTLAALDRLEGHPHFYERREVSLARGPAGAQAYFLVARRGGVPVIRSGDWRAHRRDQDFDERDPMGAVRDIARGRLTPRAVAALRGIGACPPAADPAQNGVDSSVSGLDEGEERCARTPVRTHEIKRGRRKR